MKEFMTLKILDRFKPILTKFDIDYPVLRKILQIKLLMDSRKLPTNYANTKIKENKNYFLSSLFLYAFMGLFILVPFIVIINNYYALMSIVFGVLLFLIASTVIAEFSTVILDVRDKGIILTKPVNNKTLSIAKFIHVFHYLFMISFALTIPAILALFVKVLVVNNFVTSILIVLLFIALLVLLNLFIIVITTLLYLFILKFYSGEKLKDIINYVQIFLSIAIIISYQVVGRIFEFTTFLDTSFSLEWYHALIPPLWFGAPFEVLFNQNYETLLIIMSALVIIIPVLSFIIYMKLIPTFEANLVKLNSSDSKIKVKPKSWWLSKLLIRNPEEHLFYRFNYQLMKTEHNFKLRVYPSLDMSIIFPFLFMFQMLMAGDKIHNSSIYFIYFCAFMIPAVVVTLQYSSNYRASWIYYVAPITNYDLIIKGALKAFVLRLLVPIYSLVGIIFLALMDISFLPDILIAFMGILLYVPICAKILNAKLPMSQPLDNINKGQGMIIFILMFVLGVFPLLHLLFSLIPNYGVYIYGGLLLLLNFVVWKMRLIKR